MLNIGLNFGPASAFGGNHPDPNHDGDSIHRGAVFPYFGGAKIWGSEFVAFWGRWLAPCLAGPRGSAEVAEGGLPSWENKGLPPVRDKAGGRAEPFRQRGSCSAQPMGGMIFQKGVG